MLIRFIPKLVVVFTFRPQIRVTNFSQIGACIRELKRFFAMCKNDEEEKEMKEKKNLTKIC